MSASLTLSPFLNSQPEEVSSSRVDSTAVTRLIVNFPKLQPGQFAVGCCEISKTPGDFQSFFKAVKGATIRNFDSFNEARAYAIETIVTHRFEQCLIFNDRGQHVHTVQNGQPIPLEVLLASQPKSPKAWWQVWK